MTAARRVGFAGPTEPAASLHALWIARAVEIATRRLKETHGDGVELLCENDGANRERGQEAAQNLIAAGVHAVAGYFSSAAAAAAIPHFRAARVPVVLAGATVENLTDEAQVYRVCDTESAYAEWIARVVRDRGMEPVRITRQHSAFGIRLARAVRQRLEDDRKATKYLLCLGQAEFVHKLLRRRPAASPEPRALLVTDDCQHIATAESIAAALGDTELLVAGYGRTRSRAGDWAAEAASRRWSEPPGAFFFETLAAIEVAVHVAFGLALTGPVETVIGTLTFDERGEARPNRFCLYQFEQGQLHAVLSTGTPALDSQT